MLPPPHLSNGKQTQRPAQGTERPSAERLTPGNPQSARRARSWAAGRGPVGHTGARVPSGVPAAAPCLVHMRTSLSVCVGLGLGPRSPDAQLWYSPRPPPSNLSHANWIITVARESRREEGKLIFLRHRNQPRTQRTPPPHGAPQGPEAPSLQVSAESRTHSDNTMQIQCKSAAESNCKSRKEITR